MPVCHQSDKNHNQKRMAVFGDAPGLCCFLLVAGIARLSLVEQFTSGSLFLHLWILLILYNIPLLIYTQYEKQIIKDIRRGFWKSFFIIGSE